MASPSTRKQCDVSDYCKQAGVVHCQGCQHVFCVKHLSDHRQTLGKVLDVVIAEYDHLRNTLIQKTSNLDSHPLIKKIDDWEKESIEIIQEKAEELRRDLVQLETSRSDDLSQKLQQLSEKLNRDREHDDYIENDLEHWRKKLEDLKSTLASPSSVDINLHNTISIIPKPYIDVMINDESFERVYENSVHIEEEGKVIVYEGSGGYKEIRGKTKYQFGCHKIQLLIEHSSNKWIFLGINSEARALQNVSYEAISAYGWCNSNYSYSGGQSQLGSIFPNSRIEMKNNDIITLIFDCDNHKISVSNERTKTKHDLSVDIHNCRLPWQLHVILREPKSRVRILSV